MADFIDLKVNNPASGSTNLNDNDSDDVQKKIQKLLAHISEPQDEEKSLTSINDIVGEPTELNIALNNLVYPPKDWTEIFKPASDDNIQKMAASIYKYGLLHRVTLRQKEENKYLILGGMTRIVAYRYLYELTENEKWSEIPAKVYSSTQLDEVDAKRIFIVSNTDQRQMSTKNIAMAYYNLIKLEKERAFYGSGVFSRDAAAKQADVSKSSFSNYLKLVELISPLLDEIDNKKLLMMSAYELAFLPKGLQRYIFDKKYYIGLKRNIAKKLRAAKSVEDIEKIISDSEDRPMKKLEYKIKLRCELPDNHEILPFVIDKKNKTEILDSLRKAIENLKISADIKKNLLSNIE